MKNTLEEELTVSEGIFFSNFVNIYIIFGQLSYSINNRLTVKVKNKKFVFKIELFFKINFSPISNASQNENQIFSRNVGFRVGFSCLEKVSYSMQTGVLVSGRESRIRRSLSRVY